MATRYELKEWQYVQDLDNEFYSLSSLVRTDKNLWYGVIGCFPYEYNGCPACYIVILPPEEVEAFKKDNEKILVGVGVFEDHAIARDKGANWLRLKTLHRSNATVERGGSQ